MPFCKECNALVTRTKWGLCENCYYDLEKLRRQEEY